MNINISYMEAMTYEDKGWIHRFRLIAGSLAHALKESGRDYHITATSRHLEPVIAAVADDIVDVAAPAVDETFAQCDIILLCTPVITITEYLTKLKAIASPDCIITDVGSVKTIIHEAADSLGLNDRFIGGHPMAGSEKQVMRIQVHQL